MDCSASSPSPLLDGSDEPLGPVRSPSRLDFCMEDLEEDDSPTHSMDWSFTVFHDDCQYTFIEEEALTVDIALHDPSRLYGGKDDPPQISNPHTDEHADTPPMFFASPDPMDQVAIDPQSPIPVRPPPVQIHAEAQGSQPPTRTVPQRLNYPHHGFSRSALLQQKTFWNSRHEEWVEWQSHMEQGETQWQGSETDAYTGLAIAQPRAVVSPPPYMRTPPSGLERDLANHPSRGREQDVHASIYPRVGDISALRDPYSVNIDRSFFRLPLWTLHKTLYSFDMQQRITTFSPSTSAYHAAHVQASMSSSTLSSYSPSTSGDEESDSTLVEDSPIPKDQRPLGSLKSASPPNSPPSWNRFCRWELSWYDRWELLVGVFQHDPTKYDAFNIPTKLEAPFEPKAAPSAPPRRIFCFTVGDEDDNEDDEDEDYGTLVSDSSFSVDFDEECERALAFYSRELK